MNLTSILPISPGVTAVIGSGGKTTLLGVLAGELRSKGRVIVCTSTKIFPSDTYETLVDRPSRDIEEALSRHGVVCIGSAAAGDKLSQPSQSFRELEALADYVLVEADGANRLPLKAHAPREPVIPAESNQVICVVGADGFGAPISQVCHRPQRYSALCAAPETAPVTAELAARVLNEEHLGDLVFLNKVESGRDWAQASQLARYLRCPLLAGSLHRRDYRCLF